MKFEHGFFLICDPGADKPIFETGSTQCCHCGGHFPMPRFGNLPGDKKSRVGRGFCGNHGKNEGWVCGPSCSICNGGWEKQLEVMEGTRNPTAVSVPVLWTPQSA